MRLSWSLIGIRAERGFFEVSGPVFSPNSKGSGRIKAI
jgi:hypothetical protein